MAWTDDPVADFVGYDRECQRKLEQYPICDCCQEHITDARFYYIGGKNFCANCLDEAFGEDTEKYIREDE